MKEIEDDGEKLGISKNLMMENAGSSIANFVFQNSAQFNTDKSLRTRVLLIGGIGNNGGDAFVAARHLAYWHDSLQISIALIGSAADFKSEATRTNFNILRNIPSIEEATIDTETKLDSFVYLMNQAHVLIVAIFGTGFRGEARGLQRRAIEMINSRVGAIKISVDVPSGLEADSGAAI